MMPKTYLRKFLIMLMTYKKKVSDDAKDILEKVYNDCDDIFEKLMSMPSTYLKTFPMKVKI